MNFITVEGRKVSFKQTLAIIVALHEKKKNRKIYTTVVFFSLPQSLLLHVVGQAPISGHLFLTPLMAS